MTWTEDASDQKNGYEVLGFQCFYGLISGNISQNTSPFHHQFYGRFLYSLQSSQRFAVCFKVLDISFINVIKMGIKHYTCSGGYSHHREKWADECGSFFSPTPLGVKPQFYPIVSWPFRGQMLYFLRICDQPRHPNVGHITSHSDDLPIKWLVQVGEPIPETNRKISISPKCVACNSSAMGKDVALPLLLPPFHPRDLALCCEFWAKMPQNIDDNGNLTKKNEGICGIHGDYTLDWSNKKSPCTADKNDVPVWILQWIRIMLHDAIPMSPQNHCRRLFANRCYSSVRKSLEPETFWISPEFVLVSLEPQITCIRLHCQTAVPTTHCRVVMPAFPAPSRGIIWFSKSQRLSTSRCKKKTRPDKK